MSGTGQDAGTDALVVDGAVAPDAGGAADAASAGGEGVDSVDSPSTLPVEGAAGTDGSPAAPAEGDEPPKAAEPVADPNLVWKGKKYDTVYARMKAAEQERDALKAGLPPTDDSVIQQRAEALAATAEFNRKCNEVAAQGASSFPDFKEKIGNLRQLVTVPKDPQQEKAYGEFIEAIIETGGAAARITHELGSNLELAEQLYGMRPVQRATKLAELAAKKSEPEPSSVPKPPVPVGQRAGSGELINPNDPVKADKLSGKEWIKRRQEYIDKKRASGERVW